jgi:hypothetical protein
MKYNDRPYSGSYDFVESEAYWPINHMVSPIEQTLECTECHSRNGRLANLNDFYLPGRDISPMVEYGGIGLIVLSLIGVFGHAMLRIFSGTKNDQ